MSSSGGVGLGRYSLSLEDVAKSVIANRFFQTFRLKILIPHSSILTAIVIVVLVAASPFEVAECFKTVELYVFSLRFRGSYGRASPWTWSTKIHPSANSRDRVGCAL
jgi:hypothetical protein